jgi:N-acetylmuramoyl-L-alanine amidase CwlA
MEIERKRMFIPVDNIQSHAEIVGQWNERFLLTNELLNAKKRRYEKQSLLNQLSKKVESVMNSLKKQQGVNDG